MDSENAGIAAYLNAAAYMRRTGLPHSGRWLQRACDTNPALADLIREFRTPGKRLYDPTTAPRFRELWLLAQRKPAS